MKEKKNPIVDEEKMRIQANLNNLEPGDSVNEHREKETGNMITGAEEIKQQLNNL
ncbi:MAG TPA: hypothetical protein VIG80_10975 [Bacillaceae bacterium]